MKRALSLLLVFAAVPLAAQQQAAGDRPVATINGESVTAAQHDTMYDHLGTQMRQQYDAAGGKAAFLETYVRKRLVLQEAIKNGFDKKPDVQADMRAAADSALFDRYVRDVIAGQIVTDAEVKKYYDEHPSDFATPERVKVRHIVISGNGAGPHPKTDEQAHEAIGKVATELHQQLAGVTASDPVVASRIRLSYFSQLAKKYSEDGVADQGGDLGWVVKGQLDPDFEAAAFKLQPGVPSGIVKSRFGYHIIMVEARQAPGTQPFDDAKSSIRGFLMTQHAADVMQAVTKLTNELRGESKVTIYPENIK